MRATKLFRCSDLSKSPLLCRIFEEIAQTVSPIMNTSRPRSNRDCPGTNASDAVKRTSDSITSASAARPGRPGKLMILLRLMEMPTKTRPARAAEAPTWAAKKPSQLPTNLRLLMTRRRVLGGRHAAHFTPAPSPGLLASLHPALDRRWLPPATFDVS